MTEEFPAGDITDAPDEAAVAPWSVRRILVALDASVYSDGVLSVAVSLAAQLHSELHGLFIEDVNVLRLAELPFAREIRYGETQSRAVERDELERSLRARATILRHALETLAAEHQIRSTFRVVRGAVDSELITAALETDLLALGRLGHSIARRVRLGSAARAAVARAASAVLLVKPGVEGGPILVLYDGSPASVRALRIAAGVAGEPGELRVMVWGPDEEAAYGRRQFAAGLLEAETIRVQFQHLATGEPGRLLDWVNRQHGSLLVLSSGEDTLPEGTIDVLLDDAEQHILLIR